MPKPAPLLATGTVAPDFTTFDKNNKPVENLFSDLNRDGIINEKDLYAYKGVDPRMFFGVSTNLSFGKWNAGLVARSNIGNYIYNNVASSSGTISFTVLIFFS